MSIDLNWETLTSGPDGAALAERIKCFIHDRFQAVPLPRFIKSVTVQGFDFGSIPPSLVLKDITNPLPDFYEGDLDDDEESSEEEEEDGEEDIAVPSVRAGERGRPTALRHEHTFYLGHDLGSPFLGTSTPGILGGPALNYFQSHLHTGSHTPLAAVAGAHLGHSSWMNSPIEQHPDLRPPSHSRNPSHGSSISVDLLAPPMTSPTHPLREKSSVSTLAATSGSTSRPPTRDTYLQGSAIEEDRSDPGASRHREARLEDVQAVFRIQYAGDVRLNLTAEILLDYPMPSFVGIPLKLNITGLSFDGVGVLANIRKRVHFCFLSPEDAMTAVGPDEEDEESKKEKGGEEEPKGRFGGLLQEIKVESEIGDRVAGKQSLKNVGKVERFVLDQVRRIFEEELVYPSFWTFLI